MESAPVARQASVWLRRDADEPEPEEPAAAPAPRAHLVLALLRTLLELYEDWDSGADGAPGAELVRRCHPPCGLLRRQGRRPRYVRVTAACGHAQVKWLNSCFQCEEAKRSRWELACTAAAAHDGADRHGHEEFEGLDIYDLKDARLPPLPLSHTHALSRSRSRSISARMLSLSPASARLHKANRVRRGGGHRIIALCAWLSTARRPSLCIAGGGGDAMGPCAGAVLGVARAEHQGSWQRALSAEGLRAGAPVPGMGALLALAAPRGSCQRRSAASHAATSGPPSDTPPSTVIPAAPRSTMVEAPPLCSFSSTCVPAAGTNVFTSLASALAHKLSPSSVRVAKRLFHAFSRAPCLLMGPESKHPSALSASAAIVGDEGFHLPNLLHTAIRLGKSGP